MNKTSLTRALYVLGALLLVGVLAFLIVQTRSVNRDAYNEIITTLRQLKQIDAEWNVDVLRAKTGLVSNYDEVASPLPLIEQLKQDLSSETSSYWQALSESNERLLPLLDNYSKLMDTKIAAIEHFKSQNAILRNSSRFLPMAATDVVNVTRDSAMPADSKVAVERALNSLLANTMSYAQTPDENLRASIGADTQQLQQLTAVASPEVRESVETLNAHVGTVLRQQDRGATIFRRTVPRMVARLS